MSPAKVQNRIVLMGLVGALGGAGARAQTGVDEPLVTRLADPLTIEQVVINTSAAKISGSADPSAPSVLPCAMNRGAKGTVVARQGNRALVAFNAANWDAKCGKVRGVDHQRLAWVQASELKPVQNLNRDAYGDICAAYTFLENTLPPPVPETEAADLSCKDGSCPKQSPLLAIADQFKEIENFHFGNRCLIEKDAARRAAACSFETMLNEARDCGRDAKGNKRRCSKGECERRLGRMACQNSPWREKNLQQRFNLVVSLAKTYAPKYGVDFRAIPCIATVETGFLEPMAKTLLACGNADMNRYHGLGMITRQTLDSYISPYKKFSLPGSGNHRVHIGPFRSSVPELGKPSYYACPGKLHDALGASPELQVELMAYTLAEKLAAAGGTASAANEYNSYKYYNAHGAIDRENGQPHMNNYAQAVQACVSCLRTRMPDGKSPSAADENPLHCLSAAARRGSVHPFWLATDGQIEKVFEGSMKRYCGDEK